MKLYFERNSILAAAALLGAGLLPAASPVFAADGDLTVDRCRELALHYADDREAHRELPRCLGLVRGLADAHAIRRSSDGKIRVAAYGNAVFTEVDAPADAADASPRLNILAGGKTGLNWVRAVAIDERDSTLFVLNASGLRAGADASILAFHLGANGDMIPMRQFSSPAMASATSIAVDPAANELFLLSPSEATISVFSRQGDRDGNRPEAAVGTQRRIVGTQLPLGTIADIAVDSRRGELYVLDTASGAVIVADSRTGAVRRKLGAGVASVSAGVSLDRVGATGELRVTLSTGGVATISAAVSGD